jgi:hypothetical protein
MRKQKILFLILPILFIFLFAVSVKATTETVNITNATVRGFNDTDVWESQPSYGAGLAGSIGSNWYAGNSFRSYIMSNLTSISNLTSPDNITSALYCNYVYDGTAGHRNVTVLFVNTTTWHSGTSQGGDDCRYVSCGNGIVWNDAGKTNPAYCSMQPCGNVTGTPNGTCINLDYNFTNVDGSSIWHCWNVTNSARHYNTTDKSFSFMLSSEINNSAQGDDAKIFYSTESTTHTPYLTVSYNNGTVGVCSPNWQTNGTYNKCINSTYYQVNKTYFDMNSCDAENLTYNITTYPVLPYTLSNYLDSCFNTSTWTTSNNYTNTMGCTYTIQNTTYHTLGYSLSGHSDTCLNDTNYNQTNIYNDTKSCDYNIFNYTYPTLSYSLHSTTETCKNSTTANYTYNYTDTKSCGYSNYTYSLINCSGGCANNSCSAPQFPIAPNFYNSVGNGVLARFLQGIIPYVVVLLVIFAVYKSKIWKP